MWYRSTFSQALVGAILLWAALPPLDWWPLAWIAPAWWVALARREKLDGRHPYRALWLVGFLFWLAVLHFLRLPHWATSFGWIALAVYFAFYLPLFVGLTRVAAHRLQIPVILAAPIVWTGLEFARGHLLTGTTMASLGHTQYRWVELIQIADLLGAYGVSFVVMFAAACFARMLPLNGKPAAAWPLVPALAVVGAAVSYGHFRTADETAVPVARIALIQGSIDTEMKSDPHQRETVFRHYFGLSRDAVNAYGQVDLIVWPETMFRDTLITFEQDAPVPDHSQLSAEDFRKWLEDASWQSRRLMGLTAQVLGTPLILGVDTHHYGADGARRFNSAALVSRSGEVVDRYDKIHLMLFGEYVPFARYLPWLHRLTPLHSSLSAGTDPAAFDVAGLRLAPNICYESVMPHVIRRQVNVLGKQGREPDVLVNLTNDGWFWGSSELDLHLMCGVFRAVECRKPLLIAANTGFSAWIDADGRIHKQGPRRATGTILAEVAPDHRTSFYLRYGDWPAGACLAACALLAAVGYNAARGASRQASRKNSTGSIPHENNTHA